MVQFEISYDGTNWQSIKDANPMRPGILRRTEDLAGKTVEEIRGYISQVEIDRANANQGDIHRIEYSDDGGYGWQSIPIKDVSVTAAQIFRMLYNSTKNQTIKVRYLTVIDNRRDQRRSIVSADTYANLAVPRTTHTKEKLVSVWRENGKYEFSDFPNRAIPTICTIKQIVTFKMAEPNRNELHSWSSNREQAADWGHVYKIYPPSEFRAGLQPITGRGIKIQDWLLIKSARVYDTESDSIFGDFDKFTCLSDKFYVTSSQAHKLGSEFFIRVVDFWHIRSNMQAIGAQLSIEESTPEMINNLHIYGIEWDCKMAYDYMEVLQNLLKEETPNPNTMSQAIARAVDYRDKTVDRLQALNSLIKQAKERVTDILETNTSNQSTSSSN